MSSQVCRLWPINCAILTLDDDDAAAASAANANQISGQPSI